MRKRFVPNYYNRDLHSKLQTLTQGNMSMEDYYKEIEIAMMRANIQEDNDATMARFLRGLNPDLQEALELQPYLDMHDLLELAIKAERGKKLRRGGRTSQTSNSSAWGNPPRGAAHELENAATPSPSSSTPGNFPNQNSYSTTNKLVDVSRSTSKSPQETPKPRSRDIKCFKCQGFGHTQSQYPNQWVILISHNSDIVSDDDDCEEMPRLTKEESLEIDSVEEECSPTQGEIGCLVARRVLIARIKEDEQLQRENLFYTRCKINNKECSLIIDGGSCTNVASLIMVESLGLPTTRHPHPYRLQGLSENGEVRVYKQDTTRDIEQQLATTNYSLLFTAMKNELRRISEQQMEELHTRFEELSKSLTRGSRSRSHNRSNRGPKTANSEDYSASEDEERPEKPRRDTPKNELKGLKIQVPTFKGKSDPEAYLEWEDRIEMVFDCYDYSKEQKVKVATVEFTDYALVCRSEHEHLEHVRLVLETLRKARLYANLKKCTFCTNELVFLGYVVSSQGIKVDESKIEAIKQWTTPTSVPEVPSFLGLAGFYRRFVKDFSTSVAPMTAVTKKNDKFHWGEA
ncbi:uncharacterized protein [Coffea arabica]|uniref:Retrotransposon gag domain-containing protein n=1 Tax=Coffea arabica TaxID=13443 RepID=A0A6P6UT93_COFAR|nr:uncharacterized protein LOC113714078 [Coffea arabica]